MTDNVFVDIDPVERPFACISKLAVEEVEDRINEIYIEEARKHDKTRQVGELVEIDLDQAVRPYRCPDRQHVIRQGIREGRSVRVRSRRSSA